jgi:ABC-type multidrug transport system fused ATPase/permease subunit
MNTTPTGKSTLVNFVLRFYDPDSGSVALDGRDIKDINIHSLRGMLAYVGQEPTLFQVGVRVCWCMRA